MARIALTPVQRANNVRAAVDSLAALTFAAVKCLTEFGPADSRTLSAWEAVELQGAVVHRQSRLLAGKSKGG